MVVVVDASLAGRETGATPICHDAERVAATLTWRPHGNAKQLRIREINRSVSDVEPVG